MVRNAVPGAAQAALQRVLGHRQVVDHRLVVRAALAADQAALRRAVMVPRRAAVHAADANNKIKKIGRMRPIFFIIRQETKITHPLVGVFSGQA